MRKLCCEEMIRHRAMMETCNDYYYYNYYYDVARTTTITITTIITASLPLLLLQLELHIGHIRMSPLWLGALVIFRVILCFNFCVFLCFVSFY